MFLMGLSICVRISTSGRFDILKSRCSDLFVQVDITNEELSCAHMKPFDKVILSSDWLTQHNTNL